MGKRATKYIENLKKNNAARAKEERDAFLIEHHFTETVIDENGREKIVPETVTDEEYKILREALYVDPDQKKKEEKASAGWFPSVVGFFVFFAGVFLSASTESSALTWGILIASVVSACVLFAIGEIVNGIRQIEVSTNINEQTLKEILRYVKASGCNKGTSQKDEIAESCSGESAEKETPAQERGADRDDSYLHIEKEPLESKNQPNEEQFEENQAKSTDKSNKIVAIVICVAAILVAIIIAWGVTQGMC